MNNSLRTPSKLESQEYEETQSIRLFLKFLEEIVDLLERLSLLLDEDLDTRTYQQIQEILRLILLSVIYLYLFLSSIRYAEFRVLSEVIPDPVMPTRESLAKEINNIIAEHKMLDLDPLPDLGVEESETIEGEKYERSSEFIKISSLNKLMIPLFEEWSVSEEFARFMKKKLKKQLNKKRPKLISEITIPTFKVRRFSSIDNKIASYFDGVHLQRINGVGVYCRLRVKI